MGRAYSIDKENKENTEFWQGQEATGKTAVNVEINRADVKRLKADGRVGQFFVLTVIDIEV